MALSFELVVILVSLLKTLSVLQVMKKLGFYFITIFFYAKEITADVRTEGSGVLEGSGEDDCAYSMTGEFSISIVLDNIYLILFKTGMVIRPGRDRKNRVRPGGSNAQH